MMAHSSPAASRAAVLVLGVGLALVGLVGCTSPSAAPTTSAPEATGTSPSPSATSPSPAADAASDGDTGGSAPQPLPDCAQLLDPWTAQTYFSPSAALINELSAADAAVFLPGPVAQNALSQSTQVRACLWGIPQSDGAFAVIVTELPAAEKATLVTALGSSAFSETSISGTPSYVWMRESEVGLQTTAYMFIDPYWITVSGSGSSDAQPWIAEGVADRMRALYPSLG